MTPLVVFGFEGSSSWTEAETSVQGFELEDCGGCNGGLHPGTVNLPANNDISFCVFFSHRFGAQTPNPKPLKP